MSADRAGNCSERFLGGIPGKAQQHPQWPYLGLVGGIAWLLKPEWNPDKECQIRRHDVGSSSAETGHSGSRRRFNQPVANNTVQLFGLFQVIGVFFVCFFLVKSYCRVRESFYVFVQEMTAEHCVCDGRH